MRKLLFALLGIALPVVVWEYYQPPAKKPVTPPVTTTKQVASTPPVTYRCTDDRPPDKVPTREQVLEAIRQSVGNFYPAAYDDTLNGISVTIYYRAEPDTTPPQRICGFKVSAHQ